MTTLLLIAMVVGFGLAARVVLRARRATEAMLAALPPDDRPPVALAPADVEASASRGLAELEELLRRRSRGDLAA